MAFRRPSNPNRNFPEYCPYCAGIDLSPNEETEFAWKCAECLRVFSVQFHGKDDPSFAHTPTVSTHDAVERSLRNHGINVEV